MAERIYRSYWYYCRPWALFTGTLKKTKKQCREEYRKNRAHYSEPAKITPKIISETYDALKKFIDYYTTWDKEWHYKMSIKVSSDPADYTDHWRCLVVFTDSDWYNFTSYDELRYSKRRRICLAFFDNVEPIDCEANKDLVFEIWNTDCYLDVNQYMKDRQTENKSESNEFEIPF